MIELAERAARPRRGIRTYVLDGDLVLFDERRARLFSLNSTASFVWSSLADGLEAGAAAECLSRATGVAPAQARSDIQLLLAEWRRERLVLRDGDAEPCAEPAEPSSRPRLRAASRVPRAATVSRAVRLMDRGIRVLADADLDDAIASVFGRNIVADAAAGPDWPTLAVFKERDRWVLLRDGNYLGACGDRTEIVPLIYGNAARLVYEAADCFAAVHAAAVAKGRSSVLLPAASASGKSTLTAALVANGYDYCTDDLAILTDAPTRLRPVPMQIGLKSGSWQVLEAHWPELAALPVHRRADGQSIKYLQPAARGRARSSDEQLYVTAVVFPRFARGVPTRLELLPKSEALTRMTKAGYELAGKLDARAVETLVGWFETFPCYELVFANLDEAVASFAELLA